MIRPWEKQDQVPWSTVRSVVGNFEPGEKTDQAVFAQLNVPRMDELLQNQVQNVSNAEYYFADMAGDMKPNSVLVNVISQAIRKVLLRRDMFSFMTNITLLPVPMEGSWNIVLLWRNILDDIYFGMKRCITLMVISRITDLKIFNYAMVGMALGSFYNAKIAAHITS